MMLRTERNLDAKSESDAWRLDDGRRRSLGIYYTPDNAAKLLAQWAIRSAADSILEPSFGGCSMLSAALERLKHLGSRGPAAQLFGYDVDPEAFTYLAKMLGGSESNQFLLRDFLCAVPNSENKVTAVLGNPPFVSYHRMNTAQRAVVETWRQHYNAGFPKIASLWAYFLVHSLSFLASGGRLAFILPSAFCTSDYSKPILCHLARRFKRVVIFSIRDQLFLEAGARERTVVLLADGFHSESSAAEVNVERYSVSSLDDLSRALLTVDIPTRTQATCARTSYEPIYDEIINQPGFCKLGELASVAIGEVVGDTAFFVKSLAEWKALGIGSNYLVPLVTRVKQIPGIVLRKGEVNTLYSAVPMLLRAQEKRLSKSVERYINSYSLNDRKGNRTFQKRDPWYLTSYRSDAVAFIGSLSYNAPKVVLNLADVSCGNGLYQLRPTHGSRWSAAIAPATISTVTQLSAELVARTRGPGALKLEPSDVKQLTIPESACEMKPSEARKFANEVDRVFRKHGFSAAVRHVDQALLVGPEIITHKKMAELQDALNRLRAHRRAPSSTAIE